MKHYKVRIVETLVMDVDVEAGRRSRSCPTDGGLPSISWMRTTFPAWNLKRMRTSGFGIAEAGTHDKTGCRYELRHP